MTPKTIFLISPLPGAVRTTLSAPVSRCFDKPASSLHTPVLSITIGLLISKSEYLKDSGPLAYINFIGLPLTINVSLSLSTLIVPENFPWTESRLSNEALFSKSSSLAPFLTTTALSLK